MIYVGVPSFCGLGLEDGHVPTLSLLLYSIEGSGCGVLIVVWASIGIVASGSNVLGL